MSSRLSPLVSARTPLFFRCPILPAALLAVLGAACSGGTSSTTGGGGASPSFQSEDLGGAWAGQLQTAGSADIPMAFTYSAAGGFRSLGEAYRKHTALEQAAFSNLGVLHLRTHTADGQTTLDLSGNMNQAKTQIDGSWQRFDNQISTTVPIASGTFLSLPDNLGPSKSDLGGNWAGDFYSMPNASLTTGMLAADAAGNPTEFQELAQHFQSSFDQMLNTEVGRGFSLSIESPTLFIRYQLNGELNEQRTVFTGTWSYFDLWAGGGALDEGTFILHKTLGAFPRSVAEAQGIWNGDVLDPVQGGTTLDIEFDASGTLVSGSFGEFLLPPVALVSGSTAFENTDTGILQSVVQDEITQGSQEIILRGVLSPVSGVWSGVFSHYFYGIGTFVVESD
jgi:hypothetical protein